MATVNLGQAAIVSKGAYNAAASYAPLNLVTHNGGSYLCKRTCSNIEPGVASTWQTYWVAATVGIKSFAKTGETAAGIEYTVTLSDGSTYVLTVQTAVDYPIGVANGGTGATNAAAARTNLGITPANIGALPLSGGTMTGVINSTANDNYPFNATRAGSVGLKALNTSRNVSIALEVTGDKAGIYTGGKWLIHSDGSNSYIDGLLYRHIYVGTSDTPPSGWKSGDIYLKYT